MTARRRDREQSEKDRQERLAYVGALAAGLVHEVRTPLHAIQLNVQLLSEDVEGLPATCRERYARRIQRVYSEVKALTRTLESFLTFARPPRLDPTPTDLNRFLRELVEFVQPEMDEAGVRIETALAPDMYPVVLDHSQFTHVMLNLLRNAREAIDQRREIDAEDFEGWIRVSTQEAERTITLCIEDNGIGIAPDHESKIFDVFFTTKEKGTGLGLGIVRRIVEDHRGTIRAVPQAERGALLEVVLPRGHFLEFKTPPTPPSPPTPPPPASPSA